MIPDNQVRGLRSHSPDRSLDRIQRQSSETRIRSLQELARCHLEDFWATLLQGFAPGCVRGLEQLGRAANQSWKVPSFYRLCDGSENFASRPACFCVNCPHVNQE